MGRVKLEIVDAGAIGHFKANSAGEPGGGTVVGVLDTHLKVLQNVAQKLASFVSAMLKPLLGQAALEAVFFSGTPLSAKNRALAVPAFPENGETL